MDVELGPVVPPVARKPSSVVAFGGDSTSAALSWADLIATADRIAARLAPLEGRRPLLHLTNRFRLAAALLACWRTDRIPVLPSNLRPEASRESLARGYADGVIHEGGLDIGVDLGPAPASEVDLPAPSVLSSYAQFLTRRDDTPLVTVYSSGSTGTPLASAKTARQLLSEADTLAGLFGLGAGTRLMSTAPAHHIYGLLFSVLVPLVGGGAFLRETPLHIETITELVRLHSVNVLCSVPAHLHVLAAETTPALPSRVRLFSSGARLPPDVAVRLHQRAGLQTTEVLGSTETGGLGWRLAHEQGPWTPLPSVSVSAGADGVMLVDSPFLAPHLARPFLGNDRIQIDGTGRFQHLGRSDGIVKVAGTRVSLAEVEQRLRDVRGVEDAAVLALDQAGPREHDICAALVAPGLGVEQLRAALRPHLEPPAIPRRFRFVESLPREATGKLRRDRLVALFTGEPRDRSL